MHEAPGCSGFSGTVSLQALSDRMRQSHESDVARDPAVVEDVVAAVLDTMHERLSATETKLLQEISALGSIIKQAKVGIAEVSVEAIRGSHIPLAAGELDAIAQHTAIATNSILECCEALDNLAASLPPGQAAVATAATTRIYEACSFQDITGQRITKIVKALQAIEDKVVRLSDAYGLSELPAGRATAATSVASPKDPGNDPSGLLNGPGLVGEAMDQSEIDKLLADF